MPSVITMQGADEKEKAPQLGDCKETKRKNGCTLDRCLVETPKGPRWRFKKGTMRCPVRGR